MMGFCSCLQLTNLNLEADMGADPLWCAICGENLDLYDLPLSAILQQSLMTWANDYGSWIDWQTQRPLANGSELEGAHNAAGLALLPQVQAEVGPKINVNFVPSTLCQASVNAQFF